MFANHPMRGALTVVGLAAGLAAGIPGDAVGHPQGPQLQQHSPRDVRLDRARAALFSGAPRVDEAIGELRAMLADDPASVEAHLLLGLAYRMAGSPDLVGEALAELRQALALDPRFVPARFYLAQLYLDLGRPARAREELQMALTEVPGAPQFLALLGEAERQLKNPRRAVELARQALEAEPSFAQARYYLGLALLEIGERDAGIAELEGVVAAGVPLVEPYGSLGGAYLEAGRVDEALEVLGRAARIDPSRSDLRILLARGHRLKGNLDEAQAQLARVTPDAGAGQALYQHEQQVEPEFLLEQGLLRLAQGQLDAAAASLHALLEIEPASGPAHQHLARVYLRQGRHAQAAEHAAKADALGSPLPEDLRRVLDERLRGGKPGGRE